MTGQPKTIVISGASSGIGATLAKEYAKAGVCLYLTARRQAELEVVANQCRERGAEAHIFACDILDAETIRRWLEEIERTHPIDLIIANAGISAGSGVSGESAEQAREIFSVNILGVVNLIMPLLPAMMARKSGRIAIMASMAAFRGMPGAPAYSASKAAVLAYGDALRGLAAPRGVNISVICPGYIRTPLTDKNTFPMPLLMEPEAAARIMIKGIAQGKRRIVFPMMLYGAIGILNALPLAMVDRILAAFPAKQATCSSVVSLK